VKRLLLPVMLLAASPLAASIPFPPEDPADIRKTEERIGAFRLELEEYHQTGQWAMNPPREWKKVRLIWRSGDGLSEIALQDDGYTVGRSYSVSSPDRMNVCMSGDGLSQYGSGSHFEAYLTAYLAFLKICHTEAARLKAYEAELLQARPDYPAAGERLKALALAAFGRLAPRCIRFRQDRSLDPMMSRECVRFSKPAKQP